MTGKSPKKPTLADSDLTASDRDPAEAARIRDEALKRAMGMGPKPKPKDDKTK